MDLSPFLESLVSHARRSLGDKAWSVETVLRIGSELAVAASLFPNLSSTDKCDLVCQTILKMLDDAEKVDRVLNVGSIVIEKTKAHLEECRWVVKNVLPVSLKLLSPANLQSACIPCLPRISDWFSRCRKNPVVEVVSAVQDALKHPQEYLEEMRDLVSRVEKFVAASGASALLKDTPVFSSESAPSVPVPVVPVPVVPVAEVPAPLVPVAVVPVAEVPVPVAVVPVAEVPLPPSEKVSVQVSVQVSEQVSEPVEAKTRSILGPAPGTSQPRVLEQSSKKTEVSLLPPSPESPVAKLPGESVDLSDVQLSQ